MTGPTPTRRRSGRRPGNSGTREVILDVARRHFGDQGYDRTSIRQIALEAGVDPTLVTHFYGSKQELFVAVVELPFDPGTVLPTILDGDPDGAGGRLARFVLGVLEQPEGRRRMIGLVRAAASEPEAARLVRARVTDELLTPIAERLGADEPERRASLVASQLVGLVMARYVVAIEPLAGEPPAAVVQAITPVLQHYLTGPLGAGAAQPGA